MLVPVIVSSVNTFAKRVRSVFIKLHFHLLQVFTSPDGPPTVRDVKASSVTQLPGPGPAERLTHEHHASTRRHRISPHTHAFLAQPDLSLWGRGRKGCHSPDASLHFSTAGQTDLPATVGNLHHHRSSQTTETSTT